MSDCSRLARGDIYEWQARHVFSEMSIGSSRQIWNLDWLHPTLHVTDKLQNFDLDRVIINFNFFHNRNSVIYPWQPSVPFSDVQKTLLRLKSCDWLHSFPSTCRIDVLGMGIGKGYWKIYLHVPWKHFDTKCFSHVKSFPPFGGEQYRELAPPSNLYNTTVV